MTITLAPYHPDHLELIYGWRLDPVVRLYNPVDDLSPEARGHGYATEAVPLVTQRASRRVPYEVVYGMLKREMAQ